MSSPPLAAIGSVSFFYYHSFFDSSNFPFFSSGFWLLLTFCVTYISSLLVYVLYMMQMLEFWYKVTIFINLVETHLLLRTYFLVGQMKVTIFTNLVETHLLLRT